MSELNFQRLNALFEQANTLPEADWPEFVRQHCADDEVTGERLLAMLKADQQLTSDPIGGAVAAAGAANAAPPEQIGNYRVLGELGQGGMGKVYLAEREQPGFVQQVAIKVLHAAEHSALLTRRFTQEQQLLATLNHPGIASLIDVGQTDSGLPFVVMEYIDGISLTAYAYQLKLSVNARIELFLKLLDAVSYAHRNLVVHRDLKPDNVLVDGNGTVKLLDFGIAKLLNDQPAQSVGTLTRAGAMTPTYASPEQVRGLAISTQTDVYSLGVLLYELLAGRLPYDLDNVTDPLALERQICEQSLPAPSSRPARDAISPRRLRGDLDKIVLKALRKEPDRRYSSVDQLADDLRRHLNGMPVTARADSLWYRASKLIGRNRLATASLALLFASLLGFALVSRQQSAQIASERDRAEQEAAAANQAAEFMIGLFKVSDHRESSPETLTARDLLDRAADQIEDDIDAAPLLRARLMHELGMAYANIGDYQGGLRLLNGALDIRRREFGDNSLETADSLNRIGNFHRQYGRTAEAEQALREALEIRERLNDGPDADLADSYNNFGLFQRQIGQHEAAIETLNRSISMHRQLADGENNAYVAYASHNLSQAYQELGDYREAENIIRQSLAIKREVGLENRSTYANSLAVLGSIQRARGQFEQAVTSREQSLALRRRVFSDPHPNLVAGIIGLAALRTELGEFEVAGALLDEALPIAEATGGSNSSIVARVMRVRGRWHLAQGQTRAAIETLQRALTIREQTLTADDPTRWAAAHQLAVAYLADGQLAEAQRLLNGSTALFAQRFAPDHPDVLAAKARSAWLSWRLGDPTRSQRLAEEVIATNPPTSFVTDREKWFAYQLLSQVGGESVSRSSREQIDLIESRYAVRWDGISDSIFER